MIFNIHPPVPPNLGRAGGKLSKVRRVNIRLEKEPPPEGSLNNGISLFPIFDVKCLRAVRVEAFFVIRHRFRPLRRERGEIVLPLFLYLGGNFPHSWWIAPVLKFISN